ncbi:hypothetical protein FE236_02130 [Mariprofundus erugo]|uniref:hypothetical protein n=1 Tax=Mariprofundus erugo TaxID=2528639 RepID=UPI0010FE1172|nr:hypothetical protein [Mariprofundus erugo]TLS77920.1 hypothetical protein FE236_02130 [Mariprofundus erugo]
MDSTYYGDDIYNINCTGDACAGDEVRFERALFEGNYRRPRFVGYELITGRIIRDSYGRDKQQHTFTLELAEGGTLRIKGRNLYRNGVFRKEWPDESSRDEVLNEKHTRGDQARTERRHRLGYIGDALTSTQ